MTQFNWQTEEDIVWEDLPTPEPPPPPLDRRRRWRIVGSLFVLLLVTGFVVYQQVSQRVEAGTQAVREEVLASHNLVQRAAEEQDVDLITSLMSGRSLGWVAEVSTVIEEDLFFDRPAFALEALPFVAETAVSSETTVEASPNSAQISLSPDLTEAEVHIVRPYSYQVAPNETETIQLEQTAVYRLGTDRWLFSPPDSDFWGDLQTIENDLLTVRFPGRDQAIVERLTADLTEQFGEACQIVPDLNCQSGLFVQLHFESAPITLTTNQTKWEPIVGVENGWQLLLPTPTLVGLPIDESGYRALFRGYATELITAVMLHQANWECCRGQAFATALVDYELSRLQLKPWPVTSASYDKVLAENLTFEPLTVFYIGSNVQQLPPSTRWDEIYTAVDFLIQENPDQTPLKMLQTLQQETLFTDWIRQITSYAEFFPADGSAVLGSVSHDWQLFAHTQRTGASQVSSIAYPEQDLYQACVVSTDFQEISRTMLQRLEMGQTAWEQLAMRPDFALMTPLAQNRGFVFQDLGNPGGAAEANLWQNGRLIPLDFADNRFTLGQTDATGTHLLLYATEDEAFQPEPYRLDLSACTASSCPTHVLPGTPTWSPNGRLGLFATQESFQLFGLIQADRRILFEPSSAISQHDATILLGQADGQPLVGETALLEIGAGVSPFWLDDETFGYLRLPEGAEPFGSGRDLVIATLDNPTPQLLLDRQDLLPTLENVNLAERIRLAYVLPDPNDSNRLYLTALEDGLGRAYVWMFNRATAELTFLTSLGYNFFHSLSISPNGRFLLLQGQAGDDASQPDGIKLVLYDQETGLTREYSTLWPFFAPVATFDWSSDGQWLAIAISQSRVALITLEHDYLELVPASGNGCISVAWLD